MSIKCLTDYYKYAYTSDKQPRNMDKNEFQRYIRGGVHSPVREQVGHKADGEVCRTVYGGDLGVRVELG